MAHRISKTPWCVVEYGVINSRLDRVISKHRRRFIASFMAWLHSFQIMRHRKTHPNIGVEVRWLPAPPK